MHVEFLVLQDELLCQSPEILCSERLQFVPSTKNNQYLQLLHQVIQAVWKANLREREQALRPRHKIYNGQFCEGGNV